MRSFFRKNWKRIQNVIESFEKGPFGIISKNPVILSCKYLGARTFPFAYLLPISWYYRSKPVYYIVTQSWFLTEVRLTKLEKHVVGFGRKFPKHQLIFLANTISEYKLLSESSIRAIHCNQNCFVDENIFRPTSMKKKYKAIYDSRTNLFKGHKLLIDVSELALIFYFINSSEEKYCDYLKVILPNANWLNFNSSDDYEYWEAHQINMALNQSKVGLCLSEEEGAMFASIQYLLAGLPVVTTMNVGGRDEFFDTDFVNWVADKPTAVKNGVDQLIAKDVDPNHIREKTLEKMLVHRNRFIELIQKIYDSHDIEMNFSEEWENVFFDKMVDWNMSWRVVLKVVRQ